MDNRRKTNIAIIDQGLVSGMNFLTGLLLARYLGLEGYGLFVLFYGIILFVSGIQVALIISPMMVNAPALSATEARSYLYTLDKLQLLFSIAAYFVVAATGTLITLFYPDINIYTFFGPLGIAVLFFTLQDYVRRYFFVTNKPISAFINDIISYSLQAALILVYGLYNMLDTELALWFIAATSALAVGCALVFQNKTENVPVYSEAQSFYSVTISHWIFGKWLIARNIVYWGGSQFTIYLSAALLSVAMVGAIAATRNIVGIANILFMAMDNFVPSRAAKALASGGHLNMYRYITRVTTLGGAITLCVLLIAVVAPAFWIDVIYGKEYQGYEALVYWWAGYYFIGFFHKPVSSALRALGQTRSIFNATLSGTLISLVISYPAIKLADVTGTMATLLIVQITILTSLMFYLSLNKNDTNINQQ